MKSISQIRETKIIIEENVEAEERKLSALVRAGLFDAKKLPALKRAMDKSVDKMTAQEKRMLLNLLDHLMNQVISNQSVYQKVKQNVMKEDLDYLDEVREYTSKDINDLPNIILLRRRAVRVFPDGQKVVMYWADKINRYIPIPVSAGGISLTEARATLSDLHNQYLDHINAAASHEDEDHPEVAVHLDKAKRVLSHINNKFGRDNRIRTKAVGKQVQEKAERERDYRLGLKMRGEKGILATAGEMYSSGQRAAALGTLVGGAIGAGARAGARSLIKKLTTEGIETTRIKMKKIRVSPLKGVVKSPSSTMKEERLDEYLAPIVRGVVAAGVPVAKFALSKGRQALDAWKKSRAIKRADNAKKAKDAKEAARRKEVKDLTRQERGSGPKGRKRLKDKKRDRDEALIGADDVLGRLAGLSGSRASPEHKTQRREINRIQTQNSFDTNARRGRLPDFETRQTSDDQRQRKFTSVVPTSESNITILKNLKEGNEKLLRFNDDTKLLVSYGLAQKIINIYESINKSNKQLMANMLNESVDSFKKISNFAINNGK